MTISHSLSFVPGSFDHLNSSYTSSTQRSDLALTGHRVDFSPTSPDSTSPPTERRFSPGKGTPFAPDSPRQIDLGMTLLFTRQRRMSRGIVRYVGKLPEKGSKMYVGIELFERGNISTSNLRRHWRAQRDMVVHFLLGLSIRTFQTIVIPVVNFFVACLVSEILTLAVRNLVLLGPF